MPFENGTLTVTFFALPQELPENYIELLNSERAGSLDLVKDEPQIGWTSARCLLDAKIEPISVMWNNLIYVNLRKAERKIPASMLKAWCQQEELIWMRAHDRTDVPSKQKKQIKEEVTEKNLMSVPPTLTAIPAVINPDNQMLYLGAASPAQIDLFVEYFVKTFQFEPLQINPEYFCEKDFETHADALPVIEFSERADGEVVPCRDFLTWLWYFSEQETAGVLNVPQVGECAFTIEGPLTFALAGEADGAAENTLKNGNSPLRAAEAKAALSVGKKLKKAKFFLERESDVWTGMFDADNFAFGSVKLPEGEEMNPDDRLEERIEFLDTFRQALAAYYKKFVETLQSPDWEQEAEKIRQWADERDSR
jgi:hypothetical protein